MDEDAFGALRLARAAVGASATHPAVLNAANEECVAAFLEGRIGFLDVVDTVERVLGEHTGAPGDVTLGDVLDAEAWARTRAHEVLARH